MQYKGKDVIVLNPGKNFVTVHYADQPEHKAFVVKTAELTEPAPQKVGKQRGRNYDLLLALYELVKKPLTLDSIATALGIGNGSALRETVESVLAANRDVFAYDKTAETWSLQKDADKWLVNKKPSGLSELQRKASTVRKIAAGIFKGTITEVPAWFSSIEL